MPSNTEKIKASDKLLRNLWSIL